MTEKNFKKLGIFLILIVSYYFYSEARYESKILTMSFSGKVSKIEIKNRSIQFSVDQVGYHLSPNHQIEEKVAVGDSVYKRIDEKFMFVVKKKSGEQIKIILLND